MVRGEVVGAAAAAHVTELDFNGTPRDGIADAGAYSFRAGGNPGWTLAPAFKDAVAELVRPNPPTDLAAN